MSINSIENFYIAYFGRAADPAGLSYWLDQEAAGVSDLSIAAAFAAQQEALALYPQLSSPSLAGGAAQANFLNAVYMNLFGHAGDPAGLTYWEGQLSAGVSPGQIIATIISGAQGADITALANKSAVATAYTNAVQAASPAVAFGASDITQSRQILAGVTAGSAVSASSSAIAAAIAGDQAAHPSANGGTPATGGGTPDTGDGTPTSGGGAPAPGGGTPSTGNVTLNSFYVLPDPLVATFLGYFYGAFDTGVGDTGGTFSFVPPVLPANAFLLGGGGQMIGPSATGDDQITPGQTIVGDLGGLPPDTATTSEFSGALGLLEIGQAPTTLPVSQLTSDDSLTGAGASTTLVSVLDNEATVTPVLHDIPTVYLAPGLANQTFSGASSSGLSVVYLADNPFKNMGWDGEAQGADLTVTGIPTTVAVGMANREDFNPLGGVEDNLNVAFTGLSLTATNTATLVLAGNNGDAGGDVVNFIPAANGAAVNVLNVQSLDGYNAVQLGTNALTTINVTGSTPLTLVNTSSTVTTYNGSAATGNQTVVLGPLTGNATISGGSGNDLLDAFTATAPVTMTDGAGTDTMYVNGAVAGNVVTVGSGANLVAFDTQSGNGGLGWVGAADLTSNSSLVADLNVVNGYTAGTTLIDLQASFSSQLDFDTSVNVAAAAIARDSNNLRTALNGIADLIATQSPAPPGGISQVVAFAFQGDEYVFQDNSPSATMLTAGDGVLRITGAASTFSSNDLLSSTTTIPFP